MAIREYARIFVKFWWVTVLLAGIGAAGGYAYKEFVTTPSYAATSRLFVTAEGGTSVGESYQNNLFAQDRVNSYAAIATSEQVARRASQALGGAVSSGDLRSHTTAAAIDKTVILAITVTDESPRRAQSYSNAVAQETETVVAELETSRRGGAASADAVLLDDANLPSSSTGMGLITLIAAGAVLGLLLGLAISLGLGLLDRRVRNASAVRSASGRYLLAGIPADEKASGSAVASGGGNLTAYRVLRTNVRFIGASGSADGVAPRTITIAGPGEGVGRTSVAIGLAVALADAGQEVLLIDADLDSGGVAEAMSMSNDRGLSSVIVGEDQLTTGVRRVRDHLSVLPSGSRPPNSGELIASERFEKVLVEARSRFDYVVLDTPPTTTSSDAAVCAALSDGTVVLARRDRTNRTAVRAAVESLTAVRARVIGVVLTHGSEAVRARSNVEVASGSNEEPAAERV